MSVDSVYFAVMVVSAPIDPHHGACNMQEKMPFVYPPAVKEQEDTLMRKVTDYMKGKPRLQAQVLHMLETKVLEAPPPKAREGLAPPFFLYKFP